MLSWRPQFALTLATQALCAGVGFWLTQSLTRDVIAEHTRAAAWARLSEVLGRCETDTTTGRSPCAPAVAVMELDALGVPLPGQDASGAGGPGHWRASESPAGPAPIQVGVFEVNGRAHLAARQPLPSGGARVALLTDDTAQRTSELPAGELLATAGVAWLWTTVLIGLPLYLVWRQRNESVQIERASSQRMALRQTQALVSTRDAIIYAMAKVAGFRDYETGGHLERISEYASLLASAAAAHPAFARQITPAFTRLIGISAVLHDIGKVAIEDSVLRKRGPLTPAEREQMQMHTLIAGECLGEVAQRLGDSSFLRMAGEIAVAHHERWDGSGYPSGLAGLSIPLAARIVAIVDVYDALSTPRVYKEPQPHEQCVDIIKAAAGCHFDPRLVEVWLGLAPRFAEIARRHLAALEHTPQGGQRPDSDAAAENHRRRTGLPHSPDYAVANTWDER